MYCSSQKLCHTATGNSHAIWDHTVLPATRQKWASRLYPQLKQVLDFATPEGCKAELTYVTWKRTGRNLSLSVTSPMPCHWAIMHMLQIKHNTGIVHQLISICNIWNLDSHVRRKKHWYSQLTVPSKHNHCYHRWIMAQEHSKPLTSLLAHISK